MNAAIELHDSKLGAVMLVASEVVVSLRPAYLHRSSGRPGIDRGTGWIQDATIIISDASALELPSQFPVGVSDGSLRVADKLHRNLLPISDALGGPVELELFLTTAAKLKIFGSRVRIQLSGEARYIEGVEP